MGDTDTASPGADSAIAIPLAWILVDAVLRRSLFGAVKPARVASYIAGAGLSLAPWGLAMEAARHPRRVVRGVAVALLAFLGAFGVGGQAFFRADLVLLAASMPDIVVGYLRARPIVVLGCFALPAAIVGAFAVFRAIRATERGRRAVVLSLSDHGEAWDEHGASSHTFDLYAEEIDVPLWIDAPPGSLPEAAIDRLRREAPSRPASTLDLSATVIDLLGGLDAPGFAARTSRLGGTSLLRDPPPDREVILRNCSDARHCAPDAFGILAWPLKLHYVGREERYACHDLSVDPEERPDLPRERCAPLMAITDTMFGRRTDITERFSPARDH